MRVSIIIPSYNHCRYVGQAIESVLDQDWPDIDLIVIDDGSRDGSPEFIQGLLDRRGGFRFISRENRGVVSTLNEGLHLAGGDVVCFCSSDDYLPPGSLRCRAEFLQQHPEYIAVFANVIKFDQGGERQEYLMDEERRAIFLAVDPIPAFLKGLNLPLHSIMSRREIILEIGGFDPRFKFCEDLDLQLLHFVKGRIGFVDRVVNCYRWHGENVSTKIRHLIGRDKVLLYRKYLEEVPELRPYGKLIRRRLHRQYLRLGRELTQSQTTAVQDRLLLRGAWPYVWHDPRLVWYLLKNEMVLRRLSINCCS